MRKKKALLNAGVAIALQIVTIIAGFIVPKQIIACFGSEINGLTNSISSFISYIVLLQSGVGTVSRAALYKPLADNDREKICLTVNTIQCFFRKMAYITVIYVSLLAFVFPCFLEYDYWYTFSLVLIIGTSTAAEYYFGITCQMLLEADQNSYLYSLTQIGAVMLNTVLAVVLIRAECSIQTVKLASAAVFVIRPVVLNVYCRRKYGIGTTGKTDNGLLKQRWDGFSQAIAYFIHSKTDIFVLTLCSTMSSISVYSTYLLVTTGLESVIGAINKPIEAVFGQILARKEKRVGAVFGIYRTGIHLVSTAIFATASVCIFSFIRIYVRNITDADYIQYSFGYTILAAEYMYCMRLPYNSVIFAAGRFKETKISAYIEAGINLVSSLILVNSYGLFGVALGTLLAMVYRTAYFIWYLRRHLLYLRASDEGKNFLASVLAFVLLILFFPRGLMSADNFISWGIRAAGVFVICSIITLAAHFLIAGKETVQLFRTVLSIPLFRKKEDGARTTGESHF